MINHINLKTKKLEESTLFYTAALGALGYKLLHKDNEVAGFGQEDVEGKRNFWIKLREYSGNSSFTCLAFTAKNQEEVQNFYDAAMGAGGIDNGKPGYRPEYHPGYYAAFVLDPDGNNIEAVWDDFSYRG